MLKRIQEYIGSRLLLLKVEATEKLSEAFAVLFKRIILLLALSGFLFFVSIAIALWIGDIYNSYVTGFLVMGGIYLLILIILFLFRKQLLEKNIKNDVVRTVFQDSSK